MYIANGCYVDRCLLTPDLVKGKEGVWTQQAVSWREESEGAAAHGQIAQEF